MPPLTLQESDDGISVVLHFGKDSPRNHVSAIVITIISKFKVRPDNSSYSMVLPLSYHCHYQIKGTF